MGIRFHKSIKLGNYLRLNLSGSGVSATVGKKGASINIGKRGRAAHAPVYHPFAAVYIFFIPKVFETRINGFGACLIHSKADIALVQSPAHSFKLVINGIAALFIPVPDGADEFFPA